MKITTEYIKLDQLMKFAGLVGNGSDAKHIIQDGHVKVNGETCTMRGKKMRGGDFLEYGGKTITVEADEGQA